MERQCDRTTAALWPQPQIDAVKHAFTGRLGEHFCYTPREPHATIRESLVRKDIDDVDVGTKIQLLTAKLSDADDRETRLTGTVSLVQFP